MQTAQPVTRRRALKIFAAGGAAALSLAAGAHLWPPWAGDAAPAAGLRRSHLLMGTVVTLHLLGDEPARARAAAAAALAAMRELAALCTRFDPASPLAQLNATGVLRAPAPALVAILRQAEAVSRASAGAFDVSVKPLLDLYTAGAGRSLPAWPAIAAALPKVGYGQIALDDGAIALTQPGMALTLDGIAKGAVIDAGVRALREHGFSAVLVEAGGDLLAAGAPAMPTPWQIALRAPRPGAGAGPGAGPAMPSLRIANRAVATSGDYLQSFAPDYTAHHILDPRRGVSAPELASVTVVAPTAVLADALATAIMVCGRRDGLALLQQFPGCAAYLVDKQMQATASAGMAAYLV
jgi:thiamine biosynthesis lipoprotein